MDNKLYRYMNQMVAVTNRHLCCEKENIDQYIKQIEKIASLHPRMLVLREKDLTLDEYMIYAEQVKNICDAHGVQLVLHNFIEAAIQLEHPAIHLPLPVLRELCAQEDQRLSSIKCLGTSTHSKEDALEAERLGATYLFAGNIYETDCKKGLPGRGLHFLQEVTEAVDISVYAIGGIDESKIDEILSTGAAGGCMMSGFMRL